jgi:uncharacterized protein DUF6719
LIYLIARSGLDDPLTIRRVFIEVHGADEPMLVFLMKRLIKLLVVIAFGGSVAYVVLVRAQTLKKEPDAKQLSCGQKVLVENNTCPAGQILEVTGSCLDTKPAIDTVQSGIQYQRGTQYKCISKK